MRFLLVLLFTLFLPACATVVKGTDQTVSMSTDAACTLPGGTAPDWQVTSIDATGAARL